MTPEIRRQLGAKRAAVKHLIVHEMRLAGYTAAALGRKIGCTGENVRRVLDGNMHSPRVLEALRGIGVSEAYLFDPRRVDVARGDKENKRKVA